MFHPPRRWSTLDSTRHGSNAKSVSKRRMFKEGFRQLQLPTLIVAVLVVYGITRSEQLLTITNMLVVAFLCSMGFTPPTGGVSH